LEEAIEKTKILWEKDKKNTMHTEVVFEHLGYKHIGGYGARVVAALKKFDLISESKGCIVLTDCAVDLMLHEYTEEAYINAVKSCALKPAIYEKLYKEYNGDLPSDQTIRARLVKGYEFNPDKVSEFINKFRATIKFAGLTQEDLGKDFEKEEQGEKNISQLLQEPKQRKMIDSTLTFNIPLVDQNTATLVFAKTPITKRDLDRIKQWLDLMEEPLVGTKEDSDE
jgi:hypothetical protein